MGYAFVCQFLKYSLASGQREPARPRGGTGSPHRAYRVLVVAEARNHLQANKSLEFRIKVTA